MKKAKWCAGLLALSLAVLSLPVLPEPLKAETEEETISTGAEKESEAAGSESQLKEMSDIGMGMDGTALLLSPDVEGVLDSMDMDQVKEILQKTAEFVSSEKFQRLMQYPEVRELAVLLLKRLGEFAGKNSETAKKALDVFGLTEEQISLMLALLNEASAMREKYREFRESEEGQEIISYITENFDREEVFTALMEISEALAEIESPSGTDEADAPDTEEENPSASEEESK